MREPANMNPTVVDMIKRFGGSTEASAQWPEEEGEATETARVSRKEAAGGFEGWSEFTVDVAVPRGVPRRF